jgi:Fic family protein
MMHWVKYFLVGVVQTATQAASTLQEVLLLKTETESLIQTKFGRRSNTGMALLQSLLKNPMITVDEAAKKTKLTYKAANNLIELMVTHNILRETTGQSRNRIFVFDAYLDAFVK